MSPRHGHLSSHRVCIWFVSTEPLLGGLEKLLLMGFPIHVLNVTCVSDTVNLACLTFYPVWSKLFQTAFVQHIFFSPQSGSLIAWWQRHAYPASRSSLGMRVEGRKTVEGRHECWIMLNPRMTIFWMWLGELETHEPCGQRTGSKRTCSQWTGSKRTCSQWTGSKRTCSQWTGSKRTCSQWTGSKRTCSQWTGSKFLCCKQTGTDASFFNFWPQSMDIQKVATLRPNKKSEVEAWGPCRDQSLLAAGCEPRSGLVTPSSAMASRNPRASVRVSLALSLSALSDSKASLSRCSARAAFSKPLRSNGISSKNLATFCVSTKLSRAAPTRCTTSDSTCISSKLSRRSLGGSSSSLRWSSTSMAQSNHQIRCHGDLLTYVASLSMMTYWLTLHRFSRCLQKISAANSCCFHAFSCARKWSLNSQLL